MRHLFEYTAAVAIIAALLGYQVELFLIVAVAATGARLLLPLPSRTWPQAVFGAVCIAYALVFLIYVLFF